MEFDYGQNLPLLNLMINKQFYICLLWLYIFNIHCHNDGDSTFYMFLISNGKKDAKSMVSFIHDFLQKKGKTRCSLTYFFIK